VVFVNLPLHDLPGTREGIDILDLLANLRVVL